MRVPDGFVNSVVSLCADRGGSLQYGATAFFFARRSPNGAPQKYLVTAAHAVTEARKRGDLKLRMNARDGVVIFDADKGWEFAPKADIAVLAFDPDPSLVEYFCFGDDFALTDEDIAALEVGFGDDVFLFGLFLKREGTTRNRPIVRTGRIAAMPDEPIEVEGVGSFPAYLVESRATGGMSGSPVILALTPPRKHAHKIALLGVSMGHWDLKGWTGRVDFSQGELDAISSGISAVTPIQEVLALLNAKK